MHSFRIGLGFGFRVCYLICSYSLFWCMHAIQYVTERPQSETSKKEANLLGDLQELVPALDYVGNT